MAPGDEPPADRRLARLPAAEPRPDFLADLAVRTAVPERAPHRVARTVLGTAALASALGGGVALAATSHLPLASGALAGSRTQASVLVAAVSRVPRASVPKETSSGRDWTAAELAADGRALLGATPASSATTTARCLAAARLLVGEPIAVVDHAAFDGTPALVLLGRGSGPVAVAVTDSRCDAVLDLSVPGR